MNGEWPRGFEWVEDMQVKSRKLQEDYSKQLKKREKAERKKAKWDNPYGINSMSDEEFINLYSKLLKKSILKSSAGLVSLIGLVVALILAITKINWSF